MGLGGVSVFPAHPRQGEPMSAAVFLRWQASLRPHGNGHEPGAGRRRPAGPYHCADGGGAHVACPPPHLLRGTG